MRAALSGVREGALLGPAVVTRVEGLREGFLRVHVRLGVRALEVWVVRLEGTNARPPVATGPFALYGAPTAVPHHEVEPVLRALATALERGSMRAPAGLRAYRSTDGAP